MLGAIHSKSCVVAIIYESDKIL